MNEVAGQWFESHFLNLLGQPTIPEVRRTISQLIRATINQHSCLPLKDPALIELLKQQPAIGEPDDGTPLILFRDKLYLSRFYYCEKEVAAMISSRNRPASETDSDSIGNRLSREFGSEPGDRQKLAALLALTRCLTIITGGPGTGKTSTVLKILKVLLERAPSMEIKLAAPTGKAAMRLAQSIDSRSGQAKTDVRTIHRLLGMHRDGRSYRHGPDNPISADLLIVDEASMIDLPMMHRLLSALPDHTHLLLLGDPRQLPSVDTGNVLADLCAGDAGFSTDFAVIAEPIIGEVGIASEPNKLTDAICELKQSYRFSPDSGVGRLAENIEHGIDEAISATDGSVTFSSDPKEEALLDNWPGYLTCLQEGNISAEVLLDVFEQARILCSRRGGSPGVESINAAIESRLEKLELKETDQNFYHGRPVLITRNDYNLELFNGDIGISVHLADSDQYMVVFPDGRQYLASLLPEHETCFAMTVHKAQGSEFDRVILVLAEETSAESENLMNRELLYTAITRARQSIVIYSSHDRWQTAMRRSAARASGMTAFLELDVTPDNKIHPV